MEQAQQNIQKQRIKKSSENQISEENIKSKNQQKLSEQIDINQQDGQQKKKNKKQLKINTSYARSELTLLRHLIEKNNWKECTGYNGKIIWSGLSINQTDMSSIYGKFNVNRIPEMQELAHKKTTGYFLKLFKDYFPDYFDFFPLTFLLPEDYSDLKKYMTSHPDQIFISKPSSGCQGDGIRLIQNIKDISFQSESQIIVQQYVSNPLIIDNKKFDLRLYVLISSLEPLTIYLHDEGLARFCTEDYQTPSKANINNYYMHLTNYSLNKLNQNFKLPQESEILSINDCSKRSLQSLWQSLEKAGYQKQSILEEIEELVVKFVISMYPCLLYNYKSAFNNKNPKCFHVLGIDILLDKNGKPWFLEANGNPSFNIEHEVLQSDGKKTKEISFLDKYVKSQVVEDAILIVNKKIEKQEEIGIGEKFNGFKQLICGNQDLIDQMDIFTKMLRIYGKLSGCQFKGYLTQGKFSKLANFQGMKNQNFIKNDYDLAYTSIMRNQFNYNQMDFFDFIRAFEYVTRKLNPQEYDEEDKFNSVYKLVNNIINQI